MKAILVIDIPNDLSLSDLSLYGGLWETYTEDGWAYEFQAEDIKPLPQEQDIYEVGMDEEDTNAKRQWNKGWDACLKEITDD